MSRVRWSIKSLFLLISLAGAVCAWPAYNITRIRREMIAAQALERAVLVDHRHAGRGPGEGGGAAIGAYPGRLARYFYPLAGSRGAVTSASIVGDASAQVFWGNARYFGNVADFHIDVRAGRLGHDCLVNQLHIDAASRCRQLDSLSINGDFAPDVHLGSLGRLKSIWSLKIETHRVSPRILEDLGRLPVEVLTLQDKALFDNDESRGVWWPVEALASFSSSSVRGVFIVGLVDDRTLELISAAPRLEWLNILSVSNGMDDPAPRNITEEGLRRACKNLHVHTLIISTCADDEVFDDCADDIAGIKELRVVDLAGMTARCRQELSRLRPEMHIR